MKNKMYLLIICSLALALSACSPNAKNDSFDKLVAMNEPTPTVSTSTSYTAENPTDNTNNMIVDIDLTRLSSTMVYSQVFNMVMAPSNYESKTIKIHGIYSPIDKFNFFAKDTIHYVYIADAAACCTQGLEVRTPEGVTFPEKDKSIEVIGTVRTYEHNGTIFMYIETDKVNLL